MNERFRIYAALGLAGVLILAGGFLFIGRGSASSAAPRQIKPLHRVAKHTRAQAKQALAPPKVALARAKAKAPKRRPAVIRGVPTPLAEALKLHRVVVVALVAPTAAVDQLTLREAKAGAAAAGAGFVTINVANNAQVAALSALVGSSADPQNRLLDDPAVLVFQKPHTLYVRLNGYMDADTVGQAAVNAAVPPATP